LRFSFKPGASKTIFSYIALYKEADRTSHCTKSTAIPYQ